MSKSRPSGSSTSNGHSRVQRVRRWLASQPEECEASQLEVSRDGEWHCIAFAPGFHRDCAAASEYFDQALQDEADATNTVVRGRVSVQVPDGPLLELSVRALPSEDADVLPAGQFDGSLEGQIVQLQRFTEGLVVQGLRERHETWLLTKGLIEAQSAMLERFASRWETESERADQLREVIAEATGEQAPEWVTQLIRSLPVVAQGVGAALAKRAPASAAAKPQEPPAPPAQGTDSEGQ